MDRTSLVSLAWDILAESSWRKLWSHRDLRSSGCCQCLLELGIWGSIWFLMGGDSYSHMLGFLSKVHGLGNDDLEGLWCGNCLEALGMDPFLGEDRGSKFLHLGGGFLGL